MRNLLEKRQKIELVQSSLSKNNQLLKKYKFRGKVKENRGNRDKLICMQDKIANDINGIRFYHPISVINQNTCFIIKNKSIKKFLVPRSDQKNL